LSVVVAWVLLPFVAVVVKVMPYSSKWSTNGQLRRPII